jgi:dethiobiotin synthetase
MSAYFITANDTNAGKTLISALLTKQLNAHYWKPIQAGIEDGTDSETVEKLLGNSSKIISPRYTLKTPASPHYAAEIEGIEMKLTDFDLPHQRPLIVEGAGGLLVPINNKDTIADMIAYFDLEVIFVSKHYLGSINHTLLSILEMQRRNLKIKGIIFNGNPYPSAEKFILENTGIKMIGRLEELTIPTLNIDYNFDL